MRIPAATPSYQEAGKGFSGGNQQKILLSKVAFFTDPKVLILDGADTAASMFGR